MDKKKFLASTRHLLRGAEKELRQEMENWNLHVNEEFKDKNIEWSFIPPSGPHWGGCWESLVKSFKRIFHALVDKKELRVDDFVTLVTVVEGIMNRRPLLSVPSDVRDFHVLSPNDFLCPNVPATLSDAIVAGNPLNAEELRSEWRRTRTLIDTFWTRWVKEYIASLQSLPKWRREKPNLGVGDIVLVINELAPREKWPMARVIQTFPDSHGHVRRVRLQNQHDRQFDREITKLVLLESDTRMNE